MQLKCITCFCWHTVRNLSCVAEQPKSFKIVTAEDKIIHKDGTINAIFPTSLLTSLIAPICTHICIQRRQSGLKSGRSRIRVKKNSIFPGKF